MRPIRQIEGPLRPLAAISVYSVAMAYLESSVVIYLRRIAFGNPAQVFPLRYAEPGLGGIELIREVATIIMLLAVGYLAGKNLLQKGAYFIYSFAIWDLFYYLFLAMLVGWPTSLFDFDVLFLIPVVWISPVLCPILISLLLVSASLVVIFIADRSAHLRVGSFNLIAFVFGALVDFYSFTEQIFRILLTQGSKGLIGFTPVSFDWLLFTLGFLLMSYSAERIIKSSRRKMKSELIAK